MDLGYNKEIELSEVPFPPGLFFTKNENCLELESLFGKNIIVTSSGIEIISEKESFIIERDNISNLSIETYFLSDSPYLCTSCYKIIVNLKREVEIPKTFSKNHQRLELFIDERMNSKLVVFFLMQEFSKVLNLPLINSSQNEDPLDAPNLYNFDVIKNDNQNLIIKKNSLFNLWQFLKIIISSLVLPFCCIFFIIMIVNETKEEAISITTILLFSYINSVILSISFFGIYFYYTRQGRYISIDSLQVLISKLRLIKSKPSKPKTIEIDRNMTIGINKVQYPFKRMNEGNHNFEVVLYKDYDFNSKTSNKVLIDKITQPEAEYIAQKICYLANNNNEKKLNYRNDIQTIKRISIYKIVSLILVILLLNLGVCYATFAITKTQLYTIKNPEILDHHVLRNLGYNPVA